MMTKKYVKARATATGYGPTGRTTTPAYPFHHLQTDGLWRVRAEHGDPGSSPSKLRPSGAAGRIAPDFERALLDDPALVTLIAHALLDAADDPLPPSIFIVGDRKQSIYGFRDADVAVLDEAARHIDALRPERPARAAITRSHRAALPLLRFVNDVFEAVEKQPHRRDAFRYSDDDRFPLAADDAAGGSELGIVAAGTEALQA